jgi:hypothetical protein
MFVEHASHAGRERQNVRGISLDAVIAGKLGSYVVILMGRGKNLRGVLTELPCLAPTILRICKRQLATLSAKVQTYEEVIRKMSLRFGVSDEELMSNVISSVCPTASMTCLST